MLLCRILATILLTTVLLSCEPRVVQEVKPIPEEVKIIMASKYVIDKRIDPPMCFLVYRMVDVDSRGVGFTAVLCQRLKGAPPKIIREIVFPEAYPPDQGVDTKSW